MLTLDVTFRVWEHSLKHASTASHLLFAGVSGTCLGPTFTATVDSLSAGPHGPAIKRLTDYNTTNGENLNALYAPLPLTRPDEPTYHVSQA